MSIALVVTRGYGNGTLTGSIKDVVTAGWTIGVAASFFLGQGLMMYTLDEKYYILNTNVTSPTIG